MEIQLPGHWPVIFEEVKKKGRKGWKQAVIICDRSDKEAFHAVMETIKTGGETWTYKWRETSFAGYPWEIACHGKDFDRLVRGIPPVTVNKDAK